ncbi:MAG: hypothetical protein ABF377_10380 [Akkermansiaceae bacterium]
MCDFVAAQTKPVPSNKPQFSTGNNSTPETPSASACRTNSSGDHPAPLKKGHAAITCLIRPFRFTVSSAASRPHPDSNPAAPAPNKKRRREVPPDSEDPVSLIPRR